MYMRLPCIVFLLLMDGGGAHATPVCDTIIKAMLAVADQPGVRQRTLQGSAGAETVMTEAISLREAMYVREYGDGPWRTVPMTSARRRDLAESALKQFPPSNCKGPTADTRHGVQVDRYTFTQTNPLSPGGTSTSEVWIGRADGLPRRVVLGDDSYQTIEYGDYAVPSPLMQPRRRSAQP
ncbi:hypothetical protein [Bosea vaviloviae]|nr:hypothetical protein [Bosea vaviloviae]